jgi:tetratricopeptide (TPR) repeat protein
MRGCCLFVLAVLGFVLVAGAPADAGDAVRLLPHTGKKWMINKIEGDTPTTQELADSKIEVVAEEFDKLYYVFSALGKNRQTRVMSDVDRVFYGQRDSGYDRAVTLMAEADFEGALGLLEQAAASRVIWVPQYAMWASVRCYEAIGDPDAALQAIEDLIQKFPRTKYLVDARIKAGLVRLQFKNDPNGAKREFAKIRQIPKVADDIAREVDYWLLYIEERQAGDNRGAINAVKGKYESLLRQVEGKFKNVETKCRLGIGRCLLALGQADEALAYFQNIVKSSTDGLTLAGAYIGEGDAYFAQKKWVEARRAYLRVAILWEDQPEFHAKALFRAGNCFLLARDKDFKQRAYYELKRCIDYYAGSYWAAEAEKLLPQTR